MTSLVTPIAIKSLWWKPVAAAALIVASVAIVVTAVAVCFAKETKKTGKEMATNCPSWLASAMKGKPPKKDEKAQVYTERLLNDRYGKGNWKKGAGTEYNKIVKFLQRHLKMK